MENKSDKIPVTINVIDAYRATLESLEGDLKEANKLWFGVVRLIITLSSSVLILSVALMDKLFPLKEATVLSQYVLIIGWLLLLLSIVFGILAELDGARFSQQLAKSREYLAKQYLVKISQGKITDIIHEDPNKSFIENLPLRWGVLEINSFVFSLYCLSIYFLSNTYDMSIKTLILITTLIIVIIVILNYILLNSPKDQTQ